MPQEGTKHLHPAAAFFALLLVHLVGGAVASLGMSPLFVVVAAFAAAGAAALMRYCHPIAAGAAAVAGIVLGVLLMPSPATGALAAIIPVVSFILAGGVRRGEGRISMVATATLVLSLLFLLWGAWELLYSAHMLGKTDVLAYLRELIDGLRDALVDYEEEAYRLIIAFAEQEKADIVLTMPSRDALTEAASFFMSLMPGALLLLPAAFTFAATYLLELFARAANDTRIFSPKNAVCRISAVSAGLYLAAALVVLLYREPSSVLFLTAINLVIFLLPALAVVKMQEAPRLFGFLHRSSNGPFDFAVWLTLFLICFVLYFQYVFPILATWQAISILKSAFSGTRKTGQP